MHDAIMIENNDAYLNQLRVLNQTCSFRRNGPLSLLRILIWLLALGLAKLGLLDETLSHGDLIE